MRLSLVTGERIPSSITHALCAFLLPSWVHSARFCCRASTIRDSLSAGCPCLLFPFNGFLLRNSLLRFPDLSSPNFSERAAWVISTAAESTENLSQRKGDLRFSDGFRKLCFQSPHIFLRHADRIKVGFDTPVFFCKMPAQIAHGGRL